MDEEERVARQRAAKQAQILALEGFAILLRGVGFIHAILNGFKAWFDGDSILVSAGLTSLVRGTRVGAVSPHR